MLFSVRKLQQPPEVLSKEKMFLKILQRSQETPVLEPVFKKVVGSDLGLQFIKKRLQHRCFPVEFAIFLRTPILKNIFERLLLRELK